MKAIERAGVAKDERKALEEIRIAEAMVICGGDAEEKERRGQMRGDGGGDY